MFNSNLLEEFTTTGSTIHTIEEFYTTIGKTPAENDVTQLGVSCYDGTVIASKAFTINYLTQPPTFTVTNTPKPIVDLNNPKTTIRVEATSDVKCTLDGDEFFGTNYGRTQQGTYTHAETARGIVPVEIACYNRAGLEAIQTYEITSNYEEAISISVTSPTASPTAAYKLQFSTNKEARCVVTRGTAAVGTSTNTAFSIDTTLTQGLTTFHIACDTTFPVLRSELDHAVSFDTTAPTLDLRVQPNSCDLSKFRFTIDATDTGSGVFERWYNITEKTSGDIVVATRKATSADVAVSADIDNGKTYIISARVADRSGNNATKTAETKITAASPATCDTVSPNIAITKQKNATATSIIVGCSDAGGCSQTYYCTTSTTNTCVVDTSTPTNKYTFGEKKPAVSRNAVVCCQVTDIAGNKKNGTITISDYTAAPEPQTPPPTTCTNGQRDALESDVDCGGAYCASQGKLCPINKACTTNLDCQSRLCKSFVCETASCTDGVQNGQETGVDCGGTCGACLLVGSACMTSNDCGGGQTCDRGVCTNLPPPGTQPPETEEPLTPEDASGMLGLVLIVTGILAILGGSAYVVLYEQPRQRTTETHEPIAVFEPPVDRPAPPKSKQLPQKKRALATQRRQTFMADFNTPEELTSKEAVTHKELEHAFTKFDRDTFTDVTKQLMQDNKVSSKDVEIALADLAAKKVDNKEAIDDLRKEFGLK
jgi:hypothetical protein